MYERFSTLVKDAFCNDPLFLTVRDKAFQDVVNNTDVFKLELIANKQRGSRLPPESKCPELLANYCDVLLRKSALTKKLTSDEIDEKLNRVVSDLKILSPGIFFVLASSSQVCEQQRCLHAVPQKSFEQKVNFGANC